MSRFPRLLVDALKTMRTKDAVDAVAEQLGVPKKRVYALAIARRTEGET